MSEDKEKEKISDDYVLSNLREIVERCMQKEPVMKRGIQVTDEAARPLFSFDSRGALKGLELMGKHIGLFSEKVQLSGAGGGPLLDSLSIRLVRPGECAGQAGQSGDFSPENERDDDDENEA